MSDSVKLHCTLCNGKTAHSFVSEHGEYNEVYKVKCGACEVEHYVPRKDWFSWVHNEVKSRKAYLTAWPRVNPFLGVMCDSPAHEREVAKRMGYTEQKHGPEVKTRERKKTHLDERTRRELANHLSGSRGDND